MYSTSHVYAIYGVLITLGRRVKNERTFLSNEQYDKIMPTKKGNTQYIPEKNCIWSCGPMFGFGYIVSSWYIHIDGLVHDCSNSSALAMELLQFCAKSSIWSICPYIRTSELLYWHRVNRKTVSVIWRRWVKLGAVSIRKTVLPGMAIPMLKIRRPNGRLIFYMEIAIRR